MDNSSAQFDKEDLDILEAARVANEAEDAAALAAAAEETTPAPAAATPAAAPAPAAQAPAAPAAAPAAASPAAAPAPAEAPKPAGDLRAALRAARHAERQANERLARTQQELDDLRKAAPAAAPVDVDAETLRDLEQYAPKAAEAMKALKEENERLRTTQKTAPAPAAEFLPEVLPPDIQDVVDEVPELLEWQNSEAHQKQWRAAKAADVFLSTTEEWANQPKTPEVLAQRFAAAVEEVKRRSNAAPSPAPKPQATLQDAQRVIAAAPVAATPVTAGGMRGGSTPENTFPDFNRMTDEQIINSLGP